MMGAGTQERRKIMESARKELFDALWDNYTEGEKNRLIDNFAHELAEEGRAKWEAQAHRSEIVSALRACFWEKHEVAEALDSVEQVAVRAALSHAAHELRQDADLREAEEETELAAYGRELADLIDPSVVDR
jgi:hypothetical protein